MYKTNYCSQEFLEFNFTNGKFNYNISKYESQPYGGLREAAEKLAKFHLKRMSTSQKVCL